jgi:ectoine hydroxylase-related dioxygenase (phytanoyl-CoA dioxygenase family)
MTQTAGHDRTLATLPALDSAFAVDAAAAEAYARDGHVLVTGVASAEEVEPFRRAIGDAVARHTTERRELADRDTYGKAFLQVMNLWRHEPEVAAFVHAARFAGVAAQLLGVPRVRLYHDQALFKEPGGGYTPWHQDAMYWPIDGSRCLTMWMPLMDITPDMGALTFASGSHTSGPLSDIGISDASEEHFDDLLADGRYPLSTPVPMAAGDATFHSGWTVHKASPNVSDRVRAVMTVIWFADGLTVQEPANPQQRHDLETWLPGLAPGDLAASAINPALGG